MGSGPSYSDSPSDNVNSSLHYFTFTLIPCECERNSGAYMHSISVMPLLKLPDWVAKSVYSKTYLPLGSQSMKK